MAFFRSPRVSMIATVSLTLGIEAPLSRGEVLQEEIRALPGRPLLYLGELANSGVCTGLLRPIFVRAAIPSS